MKYETMIALGQMGGDRVNDTAVHSGGWWLITALTDTVINNMSANIGGSTSAMPLPAGCSIRATINRVQLTSGDVYLNRIGSI